MYRLFLFGCLALSLHAEVIDRLAITVGQRAITELQLDEELRVTAFLNHQTVVRDLAARRAAANRLIEQLLVAREMELSHYPLPDEQDVNEYLEQIRNGFESTDAFAQALGAYDLTEPTLRDHLALQLTTLRFIEYRFRPDFAISDSDIQSYYERQASAWKTTHTGVPPSLEASKESIRSALIAKRTDEALDAWLQESRKQANIVYLDKSLQ